MRWRGCQGDILREGVRAGEPALPLTGCSTWESGHHTLGSTGELVLEAWVWVSHQEGMRAGELTLTPADGHTWVAQPEQCWRAHPGGVDEGEPVG